MIGYMTSTEIYRGGKWQKVGPLPNPLRDHRAATLSNAIFISGNTYILYIMLELLGTPSPYYLVPCFAWWLSTLF